MRCRKAVMVAAVLAFLKELFWRSTVHGNHLQEVSADMTVLKVLVPFFPKEFLFKMLTISVNNF